MVKKSRWKLLVSLWMWRRLDFFFFFLVCHALMAFGGLIPNMDGCTTIGFNTRIINVITIQIIKKIDNRNCNSSCKPVSQSVYDAIPKLQTLNHFVKSKQQNEQKKNPSQLIFFNETRVESYGRVKLSHINFVRPLDSSVTS